MQELTSVIATINSFIWGPFCLIPLLVGTGIYFTLKLRFVQLTRLGRACRYVFSEFNLFGEGAGKHGMSSFQSLATAVAGQVGTGNLAGVATAIALGGPGAIFWMWLAAFFGMATIFVEAVTAQLFKTTDPSGHVTGGPAYYIEKGLKCKPLAIFFAVSAIIALGPTGAMIQSNSIADGFAAAFGVPVWSVGIVTAILVGFIIIGGIRRIASATEKIVPSMAVLYLIGGFFVISMNVDQVGHAFEMIFVGAFDPSAATGGVIGASVKEAIRYGVARGLFSNEAGLGSTPHAHAFARVECPAQQGLVAMIGVFFDTFIVLNMTAFVILTTGVLDGKTNGIALTQSAFFSAFGAPGLTFIAICLFFFAFTTILGWYFFAEQNVKYLFGQKAILPYQIIMIFFVFLGSTLHLDLVWELGDMFNGLMAIPNLIALIGLGKLASKAASDFETLYQNNPEKYRNL